MSKYDIELKYWVGDKTEIFEYESDLNRESREFLVELYEAVAELFGGAYITQMYISKVIPKTEKTKVQT